MNCSRPAPEPVGLYETFLPGQSWPHTWLNSAMAFCWAVDPSAVRAFRPPQAAGPAGAPEPVLVKAPRLSSLPQPVNTPPQTISAAVSAANALPTVSRHTDPAS